MTLFKVYKTRPYILVADYVMVTSINFSWWWWCLLMQERKDDTGNQIHVQITTIVANLQWRPEEILSLEAEVGDHLFPQA